MNTARDERVDERILDIAMRAGEILLRNGAETYRVEETMTYILRLSSADGVHVFALMTGLMAELRRTGEKPVMELRRIRFRGMNLLKIFRVNQISRDLCASKISFHEADEALRSLEEDKSMPKGIFPLTMLLASLFTLMMGGNLVDMAGALIAGIPLAFCVYSLSAKFQGPFFYNILGALLVSLVAGLTLRLLIPSMKLDLVIISTEMLLFPGTAITNAVRDTFKGDYISGLGRGMEAIVVALGLAVGSGIGLVLSGNISGVPFSEITGNYALMTIGAFFAVIVTAYIFGAPVKTLMASGVVGCVGWLVFLLLRGKLGLLASTFVAGFLISLLSQIGARIYKCPVTLMLIPGFYPLVPGIGMYRMVSAFLSGHSAGTALYAKEVLFVAFMIAFSILMVEGFILAWLHFVSKLLERRKG